MNYKHFSEYRHKDYHIPRSMREAYGWEPPLYVCEDPPTLRVVMGWAALILAALAIVVAWLVL